MRIYMWSTWDVFNLKNTNHLVPKQALTERLDAVLLEKAESEQQCLSLKKENVKMKQEVEVTPSNTSNCISASHEQKKQKLGFYKKSNRRVGRWHSDYEAHVASSTISWNPNHLLPVWPLASLHAEIQQEAQILGSVASTYEMWIKLQAAGFGLVHSWLLESLGI